jgi:beta propeller repeat protein
MWGRAKMILLNLNNEILSLVSKCSMFLYHICLVVIFLFGSLSTVQAAQQFQGLCSFIKIEIQQELALERIGFLATLEITNNEGDAVITNFSSLLTFHQNIRDLNDNIVSVDASDKFFVKPPVLSGIDNIDGLGLIQPGQTARVEWFIIPKINAGGDSQSGVQYEIGALLAGSLYGTEINPTVLSVIPDTITVKPEPQLEITYFQPRDVDGDNPFTLDIVETPVPFTLGVLVKNVGFGQANNVTIASEQPKIVENKQGLLVVPKLLSARINDIPLSGTPSLTVDLGDIPPASCRKGAWDMITTLSGEFTRFNARYSHADELGGEATSIIKNINAYFMVHEVLNDQPGRDSLYDFLATTDKTQIDLIPDTLFESDCNTVPVNQVLNPTVTSFTGNTAVITADATIENWLFIRLDDPAQAKFPIESIIRSDGKVINPRNYWTNTRYHPDTNAKLNYLNIFDYVGAALGSYQYIVTYASIAGDTTPPVTTLQLSGQYEQSSNGDYYVEPSTQLFFVAQDTSPVGTFYRLNNSAAFQPAYPFNIDFPGSYTLEFYSEDSQNNLEATQTVTINVVGDYPRVNTFQADVSEVLLAGDALSVRPTDIKFSFLPVSGAASMYAKVEVYQGVYAWPTIQGIPSTPTRQTTASLKVAGNNVDFYQYRVNGSAWSAEASITQTIELSGLTTGAVIVDIRARNTNGAYLNLDLGTLTVTWQVDPAAPVTQILGTPATPTNTVDANFTTSDVDLYRFTIDAGYYRAEAPISIPFSFNRLADGEHVVSVIGQAGGTWQLDTEATSVRWLVDRNYGFSIDPTHLVYEQSLGVVSGLTQFNWNGSNQQGVSAAPGWYTVKLILTDGLNNQTQVTQLVQVGDLLPDNQLLADAGTARQKEVHGRGNWVVWQDQRNGSWNIYAKDIVNATTTPQAITSNQLNQERPRSDGEYVVWQARQADGNVDIWAKNLTDASTAFAITATTTDDEINPVIEWPWVIYQRKAVGSVNAPWQLYAKNLLSGTENVVDATTQDQLDPAIHQQRIVWQDFRDVGPGEIYFKDLTTDVVKRISTQPAGQYHPVIEDQWIVWADNRNLQFDLYGYNLYRDTIVQLTNTPEDEIRPRINEQWVVYSEDSAGEQNINLRLLHLANMATVQLTNAPSYKLKPAIVSGNVVWTDQQSNANNNQGSQVHIGSLPDLQPVFNNRNMIAVTAGLLDYKTSAAELLSLWQQQAGVIEITRFSQLLPTLISEAVSWDGASVTGTDFTLNEGDFLWVRFLDARILDFSTSNCLPNDLVVGINVLASTCVPDDYTAYQLFNDLGISNVNAVRLLNAQTGRWQVATVSNTNSFQGENFSIPSIAVVLIDMKQPVNQWLPGAD